LTDLSAFAVKSRRYTAFVSVPCGMPREIIVDWTTSAGSGFKSVLHFGSLTSVATQRTNIESWLDGLCGAIDTGTSYIVATSGREMDDATGTLTGVWNDATARTGAGTVAGECVADATQVLIRWSTGTIIGGRFLIGRTFIPGLSTAQLVNGNTSNILRSTWDGHTATFVAAANGFGVWHRPVSGAGGQMQGAASGVTQTELAVLRRRRR
jgi:hypothetical protein